jgi:hypothetical protein
MKDKDSIEVIAVWAVTATSIIVTILPWLQFIAVCLAIAISVKKLFFNKKHKNNV